MTYSATYSPDDNKLRIYAAQRLSPTEYATVKAAGFGWAPKQACFFAVWTPEREDVCLDLAGEIDDDDRSLLDRAEERADRFTTYHHKRTEDAAQAHAAVASIAERFAGGQPILVGHHSERKARKDKERIEAGMTRAIKAFETAQYWTDRARGALAHAKYKERPDVRARRIKTIDADRRKVAKNHTHTEKLIRAWEALATFPLKRAAGDDRPITLHDRARYVANVGGCSFEFPLATYPRPAGASPYEGRQSLWAALGDAPEVGIITPERAADLALGVHREYATRAARWLAHYENRLAYERAMLAEAGGTVADRTAPEKGGAVRCWVFRGGWAHIVKVNQISVTVRDNWGNGGKDFTRTIPFDKLGGVMARAEVEALRAAGRLVETTLGFVIRPEDTRSPAGPTEGADIADTADTADTPDAPERAPVPAVTGAQIDTLRAALKAGVQTVTAPTLFPTPGDLAARVVDLADLRPGMRVLEPSAGTGALVAPLYTEDGTACLAGGLVLVELSRDLAQRLRATYANADVYGRDFLDCTVAELGTFDRILMNPPFNKGADIAHIEHAIGFLKPGGRLVAICAGGPRQRAHFHDDTARGYDWEDLPEGTFLEAGTGVRTALVTYDAPIDVLATVGGAHAEG